MSGFFYLPNADPPSTNKMYELTLTEDEHNEWDWFYRKGYAPKLPNAWDYDNSKIVITITETEAWDFHIEWSALGCAAGTCMSDKLKLKVWDLLEEIV
jgi:hypothetical protein